MIQNEFIQSIAIDDVCCAKASIHPKNTLQIDSNPIGCKWESLRNEVNLLCVTNVQWRKGHIHNQRITNRNKMEEKKKKKTHNKKTLLPYNFGSWFVVVVVIFVLLRVELYGSRRLYVQ